MKQILGFLILCFVLGITVTCSKDEPESVPEPIYGALTYEGKTYKTVIINGKEWMAENLAYLPKVHASGPSNTEPCYYVYGYRGSSLSEAKANDNYSRCGVLYNWIAAKYACPNGWHLATDEEWEELAEYVNSLKGPFKNSRDIWYGVGEYLKATDGWDENGNGTDEFGFSGLPGGCGIICNDFLDSGICGLWWSATDHEGFSGGNVAWSRYLHYSSTRFSRRAYPKDLVLSVRCVKD